MGEKTTTRSEQQSSTTVQPTADEQEINRLNLEARRAAQPGMIKAQTQGLNLINELLVGGTLPGFLETLPGGISPAITKDIAQNAIQDILPSFQQGGLLDSGVAASSAARVSGDVPRASEQFNIGNLLNLLNLGVGGQAQIQAPILSRSAQLSQALAGLRGTSTSASGNQTTSIPFSKTFANYTGGFQQGLGQFFGSKFLNFPVGAQKAAGS